MARAFIFSLDAFVAFSLILVVLHALIFLAAVPSSYYGALMQANYLARDTLLSLTVAQANRVAGPDMAAEPPGVSLLDYVIAHPAPDVIQRRVGDLIPIQYGYRLEICKPDIGEASCSAVYDTAANPDDPHNKVYNKLQVSSNSIYFGYISERTGYDNGYCYITCHGRPCQDLCKQPLSKYDTGTAELGLVRLTVYR
ncbi:MAG: hypothetical protein PHS02_00015 [Candidatus ainarchaeum sp.]|nr:hypothetical protein [Candidatus ainarchaeum sp.]